MTNAAHRAADRATSAQPPLNDRSTTHRDRLTARALALAAFLLLLFSQQTTGFVRDESIYFHAGEQYARWYRLLFSQPGVALDDAMIRRHFDGFENNFEHPALMKTLFGASHALFFERLRLVRPATAHRLPALLLAACIPALLFLFGARVFDRRVGVFAAVSFFAVPRQLFNAELAAFDMPVAAMWLATAWAYLRSADTERGYLWVGLLFGLSLATKHNAVFLGLLLCGIAAWRGWSIAESSVVARPFALLFIGAHAAAAVLMGIVVLSLGPRFIERFTMLSPHALIIVALLGASIFALRQLQLRSPEVFRALAPITAIVFLGPLVFYAHWPLLWHAPLERALRYYQFHATHNHYAWMYLGALLREPPFPLSYVLVKTALTVPTSLFVPMLTGTLAMVARVLAAALERTRSLVRAPSFGESFVLIHALTSVALISHPNVPHFGGVKHWLPSMPFLALLGAQAVVRASDLLSEWSVLGRMRRWVPLALGALVILPAAIATARIHPYGTSAYSELAGGLPGAASLGMQRQFWSNNVTGVLPWINANAPRAARVWLHEVTGLAFRQYQQNGMLRADLVPVFTAADADLAAYQYHQEFREQEYGIWQQFGTRTPEMGLYADETPQVIVYRRP